MSTKRIFAAVLLTLLAAGCDRNANAPQANQAAPGAAPSTAPGPKAPLTASPDTVKLCEISRHLSTTLRWDVTPSGVDKVIITVTNPKNGVEKRFGHGGATGTKQSGPWLRPGVIFKVRNQATNAELASQTIKGVACD